MWVDYCENVVENENAVQTVEFSGCQGDDEVEVLPMNLMDGVNLSNVEEPELLCRFVLNTEILPQLDNDDIEVIDSFGRLLENAFGEL